MVQFNSTRSSNPVVDAKGVAAQMVGFKTPNKKPQATQDEYGDVTYQKPDVGYWSNALFKGLEAQPSMTPSIGYSLFRGQNTILGGGATGRLGWKAQMNPRTIGQFSSPEIFRDAPKVKGKGLEARRRAYSPFNAADMTNDLADSLMKRATKARAAGKEGNLFAKAATKLENRGIFKAGEAEQKLLQRGMFSHISAAAKVAKQGSVTAKQAGNMNTTLDILRGGLKPGPFAGDVYGGAGIVAAPVEGPIVGGMAGREAAMHYMAHSASGTISSKISGHMAGSVFGEEAAKIGTNKIFQASAQKAAATFAENGMKVAGKHLVMETGEKVGLKLGAQALKSAAVKEGGELALGAAARLGAGFAARGAFAAIPIINVAMAAWMVYDIAKLGATLAKEMVIKPAVKFSKDAVRSYKGQIDKAPFGMGFKDNSVLMTARQRGVMAISNSRLNARSVLGNEASALHQHFG